MSQYMSPIAQSSSSFPSTVDDDDESSPSIPETEPAQDESSPNILGTEPAQKKVVRRQCNFSIDEDIALISTWLNTNMSTKKGTDQKGKTFWTGITKTFCDNTKIERTDRSVNGRFAKIQKSVNEFSLIVAQLDNSGNSEDSELEKIQEAKSIYRDIHKSAFRFEHCWNILRNQPKWKETMGVVGRKRRIEQLIQSNDSPTPLSPGDFDNEGNFTDLEWKETELVPGKKQIGGLIQSKDSPTPPSPGDLDNEDNLTDLKWKETQLVARRKKQIGGLIQSNDSSTVLSPDDLDNEGNFTDLERPIKTKTGTEKESHENGKWENGSPLGSPISDWNVQKLKGQEKRKWEIDCPHDSFISDWKMQKLKMHEDKMKLEQEKMEMAKRNEELKIMTMDISNLDDDQKEYIRILRSNIMNKSRNQL